jgi:hypothetical protein
MIETNKPSKIIGLAKLKLEIEQDFKTVISEFCCKVLIAKILAVSNEKGKIYDKIHGEINRNNCKNCFNEIPFLVIKSKNATALLNHTKQINMLTINKKYCKFCFSKYL